MSRKPYPHPPEPVYKAGKQKERASKAISLIHLLIPDASRSEIPALQKARDILVKYLSKLDEL